MAETLNIGHITSDNTRLLYGPTNYTYSNDASPPCASVSQSSFGQIGGMNKPTKKKIYEILKVLTKNFSKNKKVDIRTTIYKNMKKSK